LSKRLSEKQKEEIIQSFYNGKTLDELSEEFKFTKLTITRNLKKYLGDNKFREINSKKKLLSNSFLSHKNSSKNDVLEQSDKEKISQNNLNEDFNDVITPLDQFLELVPLDYEIENSPQKDLSSIPISEADLPSTVYMIVDKNSELQIKLIKDCPDWQFLSEDELLRKTIEIYLDLKVAKRFCNKEEKVIKVPNTEVFKIASPILLSKGISRIVLLDKLISL
tara:strand:+ start:4206 stop:4871 length:666 start_codon:yes stop_codon:yes gene_type:complete